MRTSRCIGILAVLCATSVPLCTTAAERQADDPLATAILSHVRERLPASEASTADAEARRVRGFARNVASVVYQAPPNQLIAAALAAIDSASKRPATASELVHAAIVGVLDSIGHNAKLVSTGGTPQQPLPGTSFRDIGNIRMLTPVFRIDTATDLGCSGFDQYFDFSHSNINALILDLRGNQGGSLQIAVCLANQLVKPGVPIFTIQTTQGRDTLDSRATSPAPPLTFPVAMFIDKATNSGALALAAALQDQKRASIIGEQAQKIDDTVLNLIVTPKEAYSLPVGEMLHADGRALATTGVRIDAAASPADDGAMLAAARKELTNN